MLLHDCPSVDRAHPALSVSVLGFEPHAPPAQVKVVMVRDRVPEVLQVAL